MNDLRVLRAQRLLWGCRHKAQGVPCRQVVAKREPVTHEVRPRSSTLYIYLARQLLCVVYPCWEIA